MAEGESEDNGAQLYERFKETPADTIRHRVQDSEALQQEIEGRSRVDDYKLSKNLKRIKAVASWGVAIALGFALAAFVIASVYLFAVYVLDVGADVQKTKEFLTDIVQAILLIMATLFAEHLFGRRGK